MTVSPTYTRTVRRDEVAPGTKMIHRLNDTACKYVAAPGRNEAGSYFAYGKDLKRTWFPGDVLVEIEVEDERGTSSARQGQPVGDLAPGTRFRFGRNEYQIPTHVVRALFTRDDYVVVICNGTEVAYFDSPNTIVYPSGPRRRSTDR